MSTTRSRMISGLWRIAQWDMNPKQVADLVSACLAGAFEGLKRAGKVEEFGVPKFLPHQFDLLQSCLNEPLKANQIETSLMNLNCLFDGTLNQCQRLNMMPKAWSPPCRWGVFSAE